VRSRRRREAARWSIAIAPPDTFGDDIQVPIYDYRCDECGHRFSAVQSFNDSALDKCPKCGKRPRRLITAPGIVFKGSGWYKTDSRPASKDGDGASPDKSAEKTEKKETKADTKSETKADTKSETKADVKSDAKPSGENAPKTKASDLS
jgi:putative FmdB family regulatory protein